jgi:hypothetical protein
MGVVAFATFAHMALRLTLIIFLPPLRIGVAFGMSMFKYVKTTSKDSLLQVVILFLTLLEGLLAFLRYFFLPFENKNQGKKIQNHYHGEEENPSNFHQKFLNTNLRWGSFCKSFWQAQPW